MAESVRVFPADTPALAALPAGLPMQRATDLLTHREALSTGNAALDTALGGGLMRRRVHLLTSARGGGAASLLHLLLTAVTPTAPVFLLDSQRRFFPPAALAAGAYLPHLLLARNGEAHTMERAIAAVLRAGACALVVWDAGTLPPMPLLDRLRPLVRVGGGAFLLVTGDHTPAHSPADGATLAVSHARWEHRFDHSECHARHLTIAVTNHQRQRVTTVPLTLPFPQPLPPFVRRIGKGGEGDAGTSSRGTLGAGIAAPGRRAG